MLVAQLRGYMAQLLPRLVLSGGNARWFMVGIEGNLVATQPVNSGGQTCVGATTSSRGESLGWDFDENQYQGHFHHACASFKVFLEISDDLNNKP